MAELAGGPSSAAERIEAMDMVRGVALFGILLMNITGFGLPWAYSDPTVYGGAEGADLWSWIIIQMGFEGTQRGLFSLLFGAGVILFTSRLEAKGRSDVADIYFRRNLWLVAFGVIHCFVLLWLGEILFYYGVTALFIFAFRNLPPSRLIAIAVAGLLFNGAWNVLDRQHTLDLAAKHDQAVAAQEQGRDLTPVEEADISAWQAHVADAKPDAKTLQKDIDAHQGGYFEIAKFQAPTGVHFQSWWIYRDFFDFFSMMLIGMACFKLGVLTLQRSTSLYLGMMLGGWGLGLSVNYLEVSTIMAGQFSVQAFADAALTYQLGRLSLVVGHLGALLLFCRSGALGWLRRSLAAVGRMALSNYVSHSIICGFVFYGFGLGLYGELQRHELYYVVFSIWTFQLIISPLWLRHFRFGPIEWVWRSLTYGAVPRLRKAPPAAPLAPAE